MSKSAIGVIADNGFCSESDNVCREEQGHLFSYPLVVTKDRVTRRRQFVDDQSPSWHQENIRKFLKLKYLIGRLDWKRSYLHGSFPSPQKSLPCRRAVEQGIAYVHRDLSTNGVCVMRFKLGRNRPKVRAPTLSLKNYLLATLPYNASDCRGLFGRKRLPHSLTFFGNDENSDCVMAVRFPCGSPS